MKTSAKITVGSVEFKRADGTWNFEKSRVCCKLAALGNLLFLMITWRVLEIDRLWQEQLDTEEQTVLRIVLF